MIYKFTNKAKKVIEIADDISIELGHNYIGTEHILYGLVKEEEGIAAKVLNNKGITEEKVKAKIEDFEKTRYEVQVMSFQGEKQDEEKMKKLQEMYNVLNAEPKIKEYFDIEVRFNIMLADVNKIISESVKDLL